MAALRTIIAAFLLVSVSVTLVLGTAEIAARLLESPPGNPPERPLPAELAGLPELTSVKMLAERNVRGVHGSALYIHRPGSYGDRLHRWYFEEPDRDAPHLSGSSKA